MDENQLAMEFVRRLGLRIDAHTSRYVLEQMAKAPAGPIAVMGGDARTGVAVRRMVDLGDLMENGQQS